VLDLLLNECGESSVDVVTDCDVQGVESGFLVRTADGIFEGAEVDRRHRRTFDSEDGRD
jgi:hypothetical protein